MPKAKKETFSKQEQDIANAAKALAFKEKMFIYEQLEKRLRDLQEEMIKEYPDMVPRCHCCGAPFDRGNRTMCCGYL